MSRKKQQFLLNAVSVVIFAVIIMTLLYRTRCSVEFSDESWYVGEPYIAARGAAPYTEIWTQAAGTTFPLLLIYKIFLFFNGGTEGIVLFSRVLYLVWLAVASVLSFYFCNKKYPILLFLPLLCFAPHRLFQIDYNTIGPVYLLLSGLILFVWEKDTQKKKLIASFSAGILMARAVIGTPSVVAPCILVLLLLLINRELLSCWGYCAGGLVFAIVVVIYCSIPYGVAGLFYGIKTYLTGAAYMRIEPMDFMSGQYPYYLSMLQPLLACTVLCFFCRLVWGRKPFYQKTILLNLVVFLLFGLFKALNRNLEFIPYSWFECPLAFLFLRREKNSSNKNGLCSTAVLFVVLYIVHSSINISGAIGRDYLLYFPCIISWWLVFDLLEIDAFVKRCCTLPIATALCVVILMFFYAGVYRDEPVIELTENVSDGIWKGCLTTEQKSRDVVSLEKAIRELTNADQTILFMDWASFGYMMTDAKALAPTTLDSIGTQYDLDDAQIMYDYYALKKKIPDVIIWIDYGLISPLSIEDNTKQFNKFVNEYYSFFVEQEIGEFHMLVYQLKNSKNEIGLFTI